MKIIKAGLKVVSLALVVTFMSLLCTPMSYSDRLSEYQKRAREGTGIPAPGYINVSKHRASQIREVKPKEQGFLEKTVAYINNKLANRLSDSNTELVNPHLKKKSSDETAADAETTSVITASGDPEFYNDVNIGTGENQVYRDAAGNTYAAAGAGRWLESEDFDDVTHFYAGFSDYEGADAIGTAASRASAGDILIVKAGTYDGFTLDADNGNGISIYGGYNENGARGGTNTTTITSTITLSNLTNATEISGLNVVLSSRINGITVTSCGESLVTLTNNNFSTFLLSDGLNIRDSNVAITNNTFTGEAYRAIYASWSGDLNNYRTTVTATNNTFTNTGNAIHLQNGVFCTATYNTIDVGGYGMVASWVTNLTAQYNDITSGNDGIASTWNSTVTAEDNDINGATVALRVTGESTLNATGNYLVGGTGQAANTILTVTDPAAASVLVGVDLGRENTLAERAFTTTLVSVAGSELNPTFIKGWDYYGNTLQESLISDVSFGSEYGTRKISGSDMTNIFKGLMENKDMLAMPGMEGEVNPELIAAFAAEILGENALSLEGGEGAMEIATMLASIMANPTEEQKLIIDALKEILEEAEKLEGNSGSPESLQKAKDDFTQMVASLLLTQALPDLLEGDEIAIVKSLFQELDTKKNEILRDYELSTKAFYTSIVKELSVSMATMHVDDLFGKTLSSAELTKLPSHRIDDILKKIRGLEHKTNAEKHILAKEAEYKKLYLEPAKKDLERSMTALLSVFSQRILGVLDKAGLVKDGSVVLSKEE